MESVLILFGQADVICLPICLLNLCLYLHSSAATRICFESSYDDEERVTAGDSSLIKLLRIGYSFCNGATISVVWWPNAHLIKDHKNTS